MKKIKLLANNIIDKIAAGEVVERPASVVKELVENSIDAGARNVHVRVMAGGKQSIEVSDDGQGMSSEDIEICYLRHATSKMESPSDLFNIQTLGFRGEALASIGAVSYMTIESRRPEDSEGTRLVIEGGAVRELQPVGKATGTTITVRQLFFNTPARRKFLRHIDTEARHIHQVIIQLAAAYPEVAFEQHHQDRSALRFSRSSLLERAEDLMGIEEQQLIELAHEGDGIQLYGALSNSDHTVKNKAKQYWIVRGRPIYSKALTDAIYRGFSHWLPEGNHPAFVCWLELDPRQIDVNVHPAKREIRIANERAIVEQIQSTVRAALALGEELPLKMGDHAMATQPIALDLSSSLAREEVGDLQMGEAKKSAVEWVEPLGDIADQPKQEALVFQAGNTEEQSTEHWSGPESIWQAHRRYLLCPIRDALLVIDQQAAHERILYETAQSAEMLAPNDIQQLLFPLVLRLGRQEYSLALQLIDMLREVGFEVRDFGENAVVVDGIPAQLKNWNDGQVLRRVLADMVEAGSPPVDERREHLLRSYARHSAVKDGAELQEEEMQYIVRRLMECREPYFCPRGKPTVVKVLRRDLDRLFGRA